MNRASGSNAFWSKYQSSSLPSVLKQLPLSRYHRLHTSHYTSFLACTVVIIAAFAAVCRPDSLTESTVKRYVSVRLTWDDDLQVWSCILRHWQRPALSVATQHTIGHVTRRRKNYDDMLNRLDTMSECHRRDGRNCYTIIVRFIHERTRTSAKKLLRNDWPADFLPLLHVLKSSTPDPLSTQSSCNVNNKFIECTDTKFLMHQGVVFSTVQTGMF